MSKRSVETRVEMAEPKEHSPREMPTELSLGALVEAWTKSGNLRKIASFANKHQYDDHGSVVRHLGDLVQTLSATRMSVDDATVGLMKQMAANLDDDIMREVMSELSGKHKPQSRTMEIPSRWAQGNNTFVWGLLLGKPYKDKVDTMRVTFGSTDGQARTFTFWRKDNVSKGVMTFEMPELELDFKS